MSDQTDDPNDVRGESLTSTTRRGALAALGLGGLAALSGSASADVGGGPDSDAMSADRVPYYRVAEADLDSPGVVGRRVEITSGGAEYEAGDQLVDTGTSWELIDSNVGSLKAEELLGDAVSGYGVKSVSGTLETERIHDRGVLSGPSAESLDGDIDVWIVAGQSNAIGYGGDSTAPSVSSGIAQSYYPPSTTSLVDFANETAENVVQTAWPRFINDLNNKTGREIGIVTTAEAGSALTSEAASDDQHWDETGTLYDRAISWTNDALSAFDSSGYDPRVRGVLWSQGTADTGNVTPKKYLDALLTLIKRFRTDLNDQSLPFVIWPTYLRNDQYTGISNAQAAAASLDPATYLVDNTRSFGDRGLLADNVHYNQDGLNEMGAAGARLCEDLLYGRVTSRLRGGKTDQNNGYTGHARELTIDKGLNTLRVHDGYTQGGAPLGGGDKAYLESDQTLPDGSSVNQIGAMTSEVSSLGSFDGNDKFVAPFDGIFEVTFDMTINVNSTGEVVTWIYDRNRGERLDEAHHIASNTSKYHTLDCRTLVELSADDEIGAYANATDTGSDATVLSGKQNTHVSFKRA